MLQFDFIWLLLSFLIIALSSLSITKKGRSLLSMSALFFGVTGVAQYMIYGRGLFDPSGKFRHTFVGNPVFIWKLFALFLFLIAFSSLKKYKGKARLIPLFLMVFSGVFLAQTISTYVRYPLSKEISSALSGEAFIATKQITIPGYPNALNPSIIRYKEGYLLSFRTGDVAQSSLKYRHSRVGLVHLNEKFEVCSKPYLINLQTYSDEISFSSEDARLFDFDGKILLIFNDHPNSSPKKSLDCALYFAQLEQQPNGELQPVKRATLLKYEKMGPVEKNWSPLAYQGSLYFIYSGNPHTILEADQATGLCKEVASTSTCISWKYGEMRGSCPAQFLDGSYFTIFHSAKVLPVPFLGTKQRKNYVIGAYLFESGPPFKITKMTEMPIGVVEHYRVNNRRKIVFPGGMVIEGNLIHVVWGKNDKAIYISTLDKEKLLASMSYCPSKSVEE